MFYKVHILLKNQLLKWTGLKHERGNAGGHRPQPFRLPCHISLLSSGNHEPCKFRTVFQATAFESWGSYYAFNWKILNDTFFIPSTWCRRCRAEWRCPGSRSSLWRISWTLLKYFIKKNIIMAGIIRPKKIFLWPFSYILFFKNMNLFGRRITVIIILMIMIIISMIMIMMIIDFENWFWKC